MIWHIICAVLGARDAPSSELRMPFVAFIGMDKFIPNAFFFLLLTFPHCDRGSKYVSFCLLSLKFKRVHVAHWGSFGRLEAM